MGDIIEVEDLKNIFEGGGNKQCWKVVGKDVRREDTIEVRPYHLQEWNRSQEINSIEDISEFELHDLLRSYDFRSHKLGKLLLTSDELKVGELKVFAKWLLDDLDSATHKLGEILD